MVKIVSQPTSILTQPLNLEINGAPGTPGEIPPSPPIIPEFFDLPFILNGTVEAASASGFTLTHADLAETQFSGVAVSFLETVPPSPGPKDGFVVLRSHSPEIEFRGIGLRHDSDGNPISGLITGYSATDSTTGKVIFEISGITIHISSLIAAAQTETTADDFRLFNLGGDDLFIGGDASEMIDAGRGNDRLFGFGEKDTLHGEAGNDRLYGGADSDRLDGGAGRDLLDGGEGADRMVGGSGDDVYVVDASDDVVTELADGGRDTVRAYASFELQGPIEHLILVGNRLLSGTGSDLDDFITGNAGRSHLFGNGGSDRLDGGQGADVLNGGLGRDHLAGGQGADRFDYDSVADSRSGGQGSDIILDFSIGEDQIDLSGIDADGVASGDQGFTIADQFHGAAGELIITHRNGSTFIYADVGGDGSADFDLCLRGEYSLSATDFLL
ncbi:hypothetical protein D3874_12885 [Oleomonas cavernae]|uniref:Peptidase M10 serralysin C-terminal domain-containing protein n=1 Tax=Oleomonas cavernae TaxID=2320859 RepID=A0A418WCY8_9PROT|nr:calcium-binding protein [Oleomonas cavernae]RJF87808.1 hypothetical protein D3874_12885 [Oleomonas cavernae]